MEKYAATLMRWHFDRLLLQTMWVHCFGHRQRQNILVGLAPPRDIVYGDMGYFDRPIVGFCYVWCLFRVWRLKHASISCRPYTVRPSGWGWGVGEKN